jgi:prepilin-type N-terminal cleavage/methylation domain-containing protein
MKKGFTLIEIVIAVAIIAVLGIAMVVSLLGRRSTTDLTSTASQIAALLREAESRSMSQTQGVSWGVYFGNPTNTTPFYALFSTAYGPTTTAGYYRLPTTIGYVASTVAPGSSLSVTFSQINGLASVSTTIGLYILNAQRTLLATTSIISVASSGEISY